jgi:outer membrane protein
MVECRRVIPATMFWPRCSVWMKNWPLVFVALLLPLQPAVAEEGEAFRVRAGLGAQSRPEFIGADSNKWSPLVDFSFQKGTDPFDFEAPDDGLDIKLISKDGFSLGPVANLQGNRKDSEISAPLGKVSTTFEAGAFVQYEVSDSVRLRMELRKGIGGHEGIVGNLGADHIWRKGDRYIFSLGPRLLFSNARYQRAWFGVGSDASSASGLDEYRPDGGVYGVAGTGGVHYQLGGDFGLFGYARFERLVGDAAKSPVIRELGSRNQASAGAGLTYTFTVRR